MERIVVSFFTLLAAAQSIAESSAPSALSELKKVICATAALPQDSKIKNPEFSKNLQSVEDLFRHNCPLAKSFDSLSYQVTKRSDVCKEECSDLLSKIQNIESCQNECKQWTTELITRINYFEKGVNAAKYFECSSKKLLPSSKAGQQPKSEAVAR